MSSRLSLKQSFFLGVRSSWGYFISTFLFGVMFGVTAVANELPLWHGLFMSFVVFSASAQFAALEFWQHPLPIGTILLSVLLVSTRNILLGMSMTHHYDNHKTTTKIASFFLLNDPGVVTAIRLQPEIDRLSYITGYGVALMISWMVSTYLGYSTTQVFLGVDFSQLDFAGPLMLGIMMVLFAKGSGASPMPWIVSGAGAGAVALALYEISIPYYLVLPIAVAVGAITGVMQLRNKSA